MAWNIHLPPAEWYAHNDPRLPALIQEVAMQEVVAFDTETTGLNEQKDIPLFWSMAWGNKRICLPASTLPRFQPVFNNPDIIWTGNNLKYDMHICANVGITLAGKWADLKVMHVLLYEDLPHDLKTMAKQILGWGWRDFFETFEALKIETDEDPGFTPTGKPRKAKTRKESVGEMLLRYEQENLPGLVEYASNDAYGSLHLYYELKKKLQAEATFSLYPNQYETLWDIFHKTEQPFTKVLWKCERRGLKIDTDYIDRIKKDVEDGIERLRREVIQMAGKMLDPRNNDDLREFFFKERGHTPKKLTKGGKTGAGEKKAALDADVLEALSYEDPIAKKILEFRELDKLYGTYIVGIGSKLDAHGRIHTKFNQDIARTGRLSSSNPNLQNIPKPESDKFKIRAAFIAEAGNCLVVADYAALEMRLLAAAANAKDMIQIFLDGKDIHMGNAVLVLSNIYQQRYGWSFTYDDVVAAKKIDKKVSLNQLPPEAITDKIAKLLFARSAIKNIAFGMNYGMKEKKLARDLGIPIDEAVHIMEAYMNTHPTVKNFYAEAINNCRKYGKSWTLLGRRRFLPEIGAYNNYERFQAERQAVNNEIQGTAADVVRMAMISLDEAQLDYHYGAEMLSQVHDELIFECPLETAKEAREEIVGYMEHPFPTDLDVPLTVEAGIGPSWMAAK